MLLALLSGCLLFLAFPGSDLSVLAWIALIPLFFALRGQTFKKGFVLGFICGWSASLGCIRWIPETLYFITGSRLAGFIIWFLLPLYPAFFAGLFGGLAGFLRQPFVKGERERGGLSQLVYLVMLPSLWVALELIQARLLRGFPWMYHFLGYSQWNNLRVIQIADVTSFYGVSFLLVLFNLALFQLIVTRKIRPLIAALGVVFLCFSYGFWKMDVLAPREKTGGILVAILQANIDPLIKWDDKEKTGNFIARRYLDLCRLAVRGQPDLIVWTETAIPWPMAEGDDLLEAALNITQPAQAAHMIGMPAPVPWEPGKFYNAAFFVLPDGRITGQYNKVRLLSMIEQETMKLGFLRRFGFGENRKDYFPGWQQEVMETPLAKIGIAICNENLYPEFIRLPAKRGAEFLVVMSNDGWFRTDAPLVQHYMLNIFRAVENRRDIVAASNTGISGVIDAYGRTKDKTAMWQSAVLMGTVKKRNALSFYARFGDLFAYLCVVLSFLGVLGFLFQTRKNKRQGR